MRQHGESVADFVAALRCLTEHCEFGDSLIDMHCLRHPAPPAGIVQADVQEGIGACSVIMESADCDARDLQKPSAIVTAFVHVLQWPDMHGRESIIGF